MKKLIYVFGLILMFAFSTQAQKIALVDAQILLDGMPEYQEAQASLDSMAAAWQKEIEAEFGNIESMYQKYASEEVLLNAEMKKKRQEEIINREQKARDLQRVRFGPEGELFVLRQSLIEPIQTKVYQAIEDYAAQNRIDIIIDRNSSLGVLYSNKQYDVTDQLQRMLKLKR